jgi:hypothetical protein
MPLIMSGEVKGPCSSTKVGLQTATRVKSCAQIAAAFDSLLEEALLARLRASLPPLDSVVDRPPRRPAISWRNLAAGLVVGLVLGAGNLTFASGNMALGDNISVDGGAGTVTNMGRLRIAAPQTITGSFTQAPAGVLGLDFAGDTLGDYGALTVSKLTTLDGGLAIDLTGGFTLATGNKFDILSFASPTGLGFTALTLDGEAWMARPNDSWTCGGGVRLREVIDATSLDLLVAHASAAFRPSSSAAPEPSTWAMMLLGFLSLGGLGLRKRGRAAAS